MKEAREKMSGHHPQNTWLLALLCTYYYMSSLAIAAPSPKIKAVNLGGWLVTEGWIQPSLFDGIPNKDFLDGTQLQFKSVTTGKYLAAENGGGTNIVANRNSASGWETFKVWRVDESNFQLLVFNRQFIGLENGGAGANVVAVAAAPGASETIQIFRNSNNPNRVRIRASNGLYWRASSETSVVADAKGTGDWGDGDQTVFVMSIIGSMKGEFQLTNGYSCRARDVMNAHWSSFVVEDDFRYISQKGLNAVRIPVGWWIASDPTPPWPFVGGSLNALDNAFRWAEKYGLGVIIDLHAAPGAQNADEHGGSRDGLQTWGKSEANIQQTVNVIDFLAARYAGSTALLGVELMNEPRAPGIDVDTLKKYYKAGYDAVRKYTSTAYVIMSNRLGTSDAKELLSFASGLQRTVIDVHYYNLFSGEFDGMTVQQNIDFIYSTRGSQLNEVTVANGPLVLVGEWVAEWQVQGASKGDYQRFASAELDVFGRATFGWAYWTYKNVDNHWSLKWMMDNGYISL